MASSNAEAFVTLATKDDYAVGALVLAQSLRQVHTGKKLVVMISSQLSDQLKDLLRENFDEVVPVEELDSNDAEHLRLLGRSELGVTLTKLNCWLLTDYSKCVFLDADTLVVQNIDHLFEREEFSAAPDAGWPDCFNSGVFVFRPSTETFRRLMEFASQQDASFDGGDQGLLNSFFSDWGRSDMSRRLPFTHNVTANTFYSYLPAITQFRPNIHVVHFAGATKPWHLSYNPTNDQLSGNLSTQNSIQRDFLLTWWKIFAKNVLPKFTSANQDSTSTSDSSSFQSWTGNSSVSYSTLFSSRNDSIASGSAAHRRAWESGHVDYQGKDSFENILLKLNETIGQTNQSQPTNSTPPISTTSTSTSTSTKIPVAKPPSEELLPTKPVLGRPIESPPPASTLATTKKEIKSSFSSAVEIPVERVVEAKKPLLSRPVEPAPKKEIKSASSSVSVSSSSSSSSSSLEPSSQSKGAEWTVRSTIITAHQQGVGEFAGPTTISKSVTETVASIHEAPPLVKDSPKSVVEKRIDSSPPSSAYVHWTLNKAFLAFTYTISLVYFFFIFLFRKSSDKHSTRHAEEISSASASPRTKPTEKLVEQVKKH